MPLHVQTLKDTFLRDTERKEMEKNISSGNILKKKKKRGRNKKNLYCFDFIQNVCFAVRMLGVGSDLTELSWV